MAIATRLTKPIFLSSRSIAAFASALGMRKRDATSPSAFPLRAFQKRKPTRAKVSLAILLLTASLTAPSAVPAAAADNSPATIFGLPLGQPFTVPECKRVNGAPIFGETCWTYAFGETDPSFRKMWFQDAPELGRETNAHVTDGKLDFVTVDTRGISEQGRIMSVLHSKFGKPVMFHREILQNAFGAKFTVDHARWETQGIVAKYDGVSYENETDKGWLLVSTKEFDDKEQREIEKNRGKIPIQRF